jgi:hypothetical protein
MKSKTLSASRARQILTVAQKTCVLVVGDVMLVGSSGAAFLN